MERGQVLVIVTLSVIALTAIVGLAVDTGLLYLSHGKLRRAVDAAALAATAQFREGYSVEDLQKAAYEFLVLNGINDPSAIVETCETNPGDDVLCPPKGKPARKLVRVRATSVVNLTFLSVIGIHQTTVTAEAVSEAASMDVVLAIDMSDSMTWDAAADDPMYDPSQCNPLNACHPFKEVKDAAEAFVTELYFPYDRVSIVTFDHGARVVLPFSKDEAEIKNTIRGLEVFSPPVCPIEPGTCRLYERDPDTLEPKDIDGDGVIQYFGLDCPVFWSKGNPDTCGTTNIGGGFLGAGEAFSDEDTFRQEALLVVILLTDGAANAPSYHCPNSTYTAPYCRDNNPNSRHCFEADDTYCLTHGGVLDPEDYDTDDFARHQADFVATEQDALVFTIGLGKLVRESPPRIKLDASGKPTTTKCIDRDDPETPTIEVPDPLDACWGAGEQLLRYAADVGRGKYYYSPSGNQLKEIFLDIAQYLATRLTQ